MDQRLTDVFVVPINKNDASCVCVSQHLKSEARKRIIYLPPYLPTYLRTYLPTYLPYPPTGIERPFVLATAAYHHRSSPPINTNILSTHPYPKTLQFIMKFTSIASSILLLAFTADAFTPSSLIRLVTACALRFHLVYF